MGRHNLHFSDKEAAQNWADRDGGEVIDNTGSVGWKGQSTNYTVSQHIDDSGVDNPNNWQFPPKGWTCEAQKVWPQWMVVYHYEHGKGCIGIYRDEYDQCVPVHFDKYDMKLYYPNSDDLIQLRLLSFTPYTLEEGGYSRKKEHMKFLR